MSIAFEVENPELAQFDPARAGIFNPESMVTTERPSLLQARLVGSLVLSESPRFPDNLDDSEDPEMLAEDTSDKLMGYFDTTQLHEAFRGTIKKESQLLMVSALIVQNGEAVYADDITRFFKEDIGKRKHDLRTVIKSINDSEYADQMKKYGGSGYGRDTKYKFGSEWYPNEYKDYMQEQLAERIANFEMRQPSQRTIGSSKIPLLPKADKDKDNSSTSTLRRNDSVDWDRAICPQTDPDAYFPEAGLTTRALKKICMSCDIREDCLQYALDNDERFGVWGGLSESERRKLKKKEA